jgi:hypothetical protein
MDRKHRNGAEYTRRHVTRSGHFLAEYLPAVGMGDVVPLARQLVHFSGYEIDVPAIPLRDPKQRVLGKLLGTADLLAQMSDRCYLEKCRDRLYLEFASAGLTAPGAPGGGYASPSELIYKTGFFFEHALERLDKVLKGAHRHAECFFFPTRNLYMDAIRKNFDYLQVVERRRNMLLLRRKPPWTLTIEPEAVRLAA